MTTRNDHYSCFEQNVLVFKKKQTYIPKNCYKIDNDDT